MKRVELDDWQIRENKKWENKKWDWKYIGKVRKVKSKIINYKGWNLMKNGLNYIILDDNPMMNIELSINSLDEQLQMDFDDYKKGDFLKSLRKQKLEQLKKIK